MTRVVSVPGFVSVHSHSVGRALRGRFPGAAGPRFFELALEAAARRSSSDLRALFARVYREMRRAGITAVGEANLLGSGAAAAAAGAAEEEGIQLVCLHAAAGRGALPHLQSSVAGYLREVDELRSRGHTVELAIASVISCPPDWLQEIGRHAARDRRPLHVTAYERPHEIAACRAEHGLRPMELLARTGCLGPHVTIAHATHADGSDLDRAAASGCTICACPSGDADLANGFLPVNRILHRSIPLCIGTDVCAVVDPLGELRELEWIARRQQGARGVLPPGTLLEIGGDRGALALGIGRRDSIEVDLDHPALAGVEAADVPAALVQGCPPCVVVAPAA